MVVIIVAAVVFIVNLLSGLFTIRQRHSQICKEDYGRSIFTCIAHTINVRQDRIPSASQMGTCVN